MREAVDALLQGGFSCIPVVDDHDVPQGIVSWRDVLRHLSARDNVT
ncbi:MAG TPA: CBS domain-containing protein [Burkholderiaceae bacterium]|nr:CBS domain-containing protein [Rhodoferax sp.]HQZ06699.1 CBS domain-containing protein [Burkholderiaceae bacterium]